MTQVSKEKIGLLAGAGRFPILFAQEAKRMGHAIVAVGVRNVTDQSLEAEVAEMHYFKIGQIEGPIQVMKKAGVRKAIMAGKVQHGSIFRDLLPDFRALKVLAGLRDKRADTILKAVADEFAKDGIEFISSATYLQHLIAQPGVLTRREPDPGEMRDVELGWKAAKALAGMDVGQTVVVSSGAVVALEGLEGTDACICRAHELTRSDGTGVNLVVVKVAKPKQDLRFDLPVIGIETIEVLRSAGARLLAVEAGKNLILDKTHVLAAADRAGICIIALKPERMEAGT
jgi:DUF1009 family protein